ncbi:hypothetical protein OG618_37945 (plasmid) [Kitasatospora sp. NBC_01246]|uniref:hypothetical protein n=1 Tax=Kitasatospora sp. NBC_01246 TaxID=2903570 RepID=UPI002E32E642|nr:hypothetical protein [Kitasatospora sp. NBC_01246]
MANTEYDPDADRHGYSRTALARLAYSDELAELADQAAAHVPTIHDLFSNRGEAVGEALALVALAEAVLTRAVVYERQRGASWQQIGDQLDIARQSAHERYREVEEDWQLGLVEPLYPAQPVNIHGQVPVRGLRLPDAAYSPTPAAQRLDQWVRDHLPRHRDTEHPVSGRLPKLTAAEEISQVLAAITHLQETDAGPAERAAVMERKAALLERIAAEEGKPDALQKAAEARAYATQLRADAKARP